MHASRCTLLLLLALLIAGCGGGGPDLTVYSGRSEELVGQLMKDFEKDSGLKIEVRYADSAELAATLQEEGSGSPADVFFAQDAGSLGAVESQLAPLPADELAAVPKRFQDPRGRWMGTSARARVVAYSTKRLKESALPDTILDFTKPEWKGRIGIAPPNASFQAFVSAMRLEIGDQRTRQWLEGIKRNKPMLFENNIQVEEAIARGEIDVGFVNHYYIYELREERPDAPVANHYLRAGDPGSLVNAAGVGVLKTSEHKENAEKFARFLISRKGQVYFTHAEWEYPVTAGVAPPKGLPPLEQLVGPQKVSLGDLGVKLKSTLKMLDEVGLTS
jgi:iron(III) transport system substrate-binding protein